VNKACTPLPPGNVPPLGIPTWQGVDCKDDPGLVSAYFRVPRGTDDGDFFRLPFPNDVRRKSSGHPDLTGFPTPGSDLLGFDVVDRYARDVEQNADGFSVYPSIVFRFSGSVDFDSLKQAGALRMVDLSTGAGGNDVGFGWTATTGRSPYVCPNAVYVRPPSGAPLKPGGTYGFFFTNAIKAATGGAVARAPDLAALLAGTAPTDSALTAAYAAYKPLRDWASAKSFDLSTVVQAAVFTTAHTISAASALASAVAAQSVPSPTNWINCAKAPSPCPQAQGDRACGAANAAFDELHALVSLPIFQKGTEPYLNPPDGDLVYDNTGKPVVQRTEQVCLSLTVPKTGSAPYPLVIYAHGTGGSFRSQVPEGVADRLANVDGTNHIAVLGIDQVAHGTRRGGSQMSPDDLFFNFANPGAARGNPLQGAADQMMLARIAQAIDIKASDPGGSPTGADIKFGTIGFWGHSQGATEGAIAMPYTPGVRGVVLSGVGASLIDALLSKTSPVNIAAAVPFVLVDPGANALHPVLTVMQNAEDPADPLSHAQLLAAQPVTGPLGKHAFVPYGQKDTYAPPVVQSTYVLAGGLGLAAPPASVTAPDAIGSLSPTATPAGPNLATNTLTGYVREYSPSGYDGHFVSYRDADAKKDVDHFLADVTSGQTPRIGR
jgi:hypothetical protein